MCKGFLPLLSNGECGGYAMKFVMLTSTYDKAALLNSSLLGPPIR